MRQASLEPIAVNADNGSALEQFFESVRTCNPFLVNRVDRPLSSGLIDVFGIHDAEFRRLLNLSRQAHREQCGIGAIVWGEAGIGKTHLLARLGRWAQQSRQAVFVYLHNLQAHPQRVPISVLQAVLASLTGGRAVPHHQTNLFILLNSAVRKALDEAGLERAAWPQIADAFQRLAGRFADDDPTGGVLFNPAVYDVLFRYYQSAHPIQKGQKAGSAALALRWLAGEALTPDAPAKDSAPRLAGISEAQHAKQVFSALCRLAHCAKKLLLLGFDQIDNLDEDQIKPLSRFLHDLLDSTGNLLVVTTGVRETLFGFLRNGTITETSWDRIGQVEIALHRISKERGRELVLSRLQNFMQCARGLPEIEELIMKDALFPLGSAWFEQRMGSLTDVRPRDLLTWASQRWQDHQEMLTTTPGIVWLERMQKDYAPGNNGSYVADVQASLADVLDKLIVDYVAKCRQKPNVLPPHQEKLRDILTKALKLAKASGLYATLLEAQIVLDSKGTHAGYDLIVRHRLQTGEYICIGVCCLVLTSANSSVAAFRRLLDHAHPPELTVMVTDKRQSLPLGDKGRVLLQKLLAQGEQRFQRIDLSIEEIAELDALCAIVEMARKNQLQQYLPESAEEHVSEDEMVKTLFKLPRWRSHRLLRVLVGEW